MKNGSIVETLHPNILLVLVGPTAVGKTDFAIQLAKAFRTEIVSADSRQFYREMSIGTAKPELDEMQGIPHHFIDFLNVDQPFNAYDYELEAVNLLEDLYRKNKLVILTGGSGLYVKAICDGIDQMPDIPENIRNQLKMELKEKGLSFLLDQLKTVDPEYFEQVDQQNPSRVIRGLELYLTSGIPYSKFRTGKKAIRNFRTIKIGLEREKQDLYDRINQRMDEMIARGLFEEAKNLLEKRNLTALNTVGYKEIFDFLEGKYDREEAIRLLKRNSRRYAKRQMTWFKKDEEIKWFHPDEYAMVVDFIKQKIS